MHTQTLPRLGVSRYAVRRRRDLDLQVAEAVRLTSAVAREVEDTRLKREEAATKLKQACWGTAATKSRWVMDETRWRGVPTANLGPEPMFARTSNKLGAPIW